MKNKEIIIKKLTEERDHIKFNTNAHYTINNCDYKPPDIKYKDKIDTFQVKKVSLEDIKVMDDYIYTNNEATQNINKITNGKQACSSGSGSESMIKFIKNLFMSKK